jgi:hypothetical protein
MEDKDEQSEAPELLEHDVAPPSHTPGCLGVIGGFVAHFMIYALMGVVADSSLDFDIVLLVVWPAFQLTVAGFFIFHGTRRSGPFAPGGDGLFTALGATLAVLILVNGLCIYMMNVPA